MSETKPGGGAKAGAEQERAIEALYDVIAGVTRVQERIAAGEPVGRAALERLQGAVRDVEHSLGNREAKEQKAQLLKEIVDCFSREFRSLSIQSIRRLEALSTAVFRNLINGRDGKKSLVALLNEYNLLPRLGIEPSNTVAKEIQIENSAGYSVAIQLWAGEDGQLSLKSPDPSVQGFIREITRASSEQ